MSLFFRGINVCGRFPFVRLIQVADNPAYLLHIIKKNLIYKRDRTDYSKKYAPIKFLTGQETLVDLITNGKSLARFSDGEFEQITGGGEYPPDSDWCQRWSKALKDDLLATLSSTNPRLLVAVDPPSTFLAPHNSSHSIRFEYNMWVDLRRLMWKYLSPKVAYGHCHLFIKANCPDLNWNQLRNYLRSKDIIIATGDTHKLAHLKLGQKTFFIECGTENAYERKEAIKQSIHEMISAENLDKKSTIVLLSLGPTAGILAHQLLDEQICVWDTGHMFKYAAENLADSTNG